jgi:hypothetical protein
MSNPVIPTFWPAMARCFRCGRFVKRGIVNMVRHMDDCPSAVMKVPSKKKISKKDFFNGMKPQRPLFFLTGGKTFNEAYENSGYADKNIVDLIKEDHAKSN